MALVVVMAINLYEHQKDAVEKLETGSILVGGVGSGKSRTALAYYFMKECEGKIKTNGVGGFSPMKNPKDLYVITTARKRDTLEWEKEGCPFLLSTNKEISAGGVGVFIDSWNNIKKYTHIKNAFFIFDEQRVIGNGTWVKSFLTIAKNNNWILLSATPGDTWMDYIPVFIANGWYKNRTEFIRRHVVFSRFTRYPKVERYIEINRLIRLREAVTVQMRYKKRTIAREKTIITSFDKDLFNKVAVKRWNVYENRPARDAGELCYLMRRVVNTDPSRIQAVRELIIKHSRAIVFYNFNYERELLLDLGEKLNLSTAEWSGHKHQLIPEAESWMYLVQYAAGSEGWNCVQTDTVIFYSQNYSYKTKVQAAGRIDRLNTPFVELFYYHLRSNSTIDVAIEKAVKNKKDFNERRFMGV